MDERTKKINVYFALPPNTIVLTCIECMKSYLSVKACDSQPVCFICVQVSNVNFQFMLAGSKLLNLQF